MGIFDTVSPLKCSAQSLRISRCTRQKRSFALSLKQPKGIIMTTTVRMSVALSEDEKTATISKTGRSDPIVCNCLGVERDAQGQLVTLYLDSLIHHAKKNIKYEQWKPSGAVSTILRKVA